MIVGERNGMCNGVDRNELEVDVIEDDEGDEGDESSGNGRANM